MVAAMKWHRNSVGVEIDREYCRMAARRLRHESSDLFLEAELHFLKSVEDDQEGFQICEETARYVGSKKALSTAPRKWVPG